ncbi:hypothetical protein HG535_0D00220 [Zygotorulaspora mrakii]|uniref:A2 transcriptional factor n=1 Tax=Zygotorulaspora mrakii TaxID=42260 RepID=A0A7H9B0W0_ZYGMR|nr:uncharacterized protein HG535_0D00220 [Zygotorulaspora mrakii]QLG72315.1 hypothetical protein HG535_0D00220 [Zygotorulaspora mrakii]
MFFTECMLPKRGDIDEEYTDFIFFKDESRKSSNRVKFKFVGQKIHEDKQVEEFNLSVEYKSSKMGMLITRPRNRFIIMRTILYNTIIRSLEKCDLSSLKDVSAITSQLWGKNDGIFQLYFELLSQFEEHWHLNIYPEYRYHKVNKISRQLENKLVYQNMLNRMRYFTASSLLSKLEDIVTLPAASATDAAGTAPTAAEPFSSTYTYSSFHSSQIRANHLHHYHYQNRQKRQSTTTRSNSQQPNLPSLQNPHSSETLQNCHWKIKKSSSCKRTRNHNFALPKQDHRCDRIKFDFPKKKLLPPDLNTVSNNTNPSRFPSTSSMKKPLQYSTLPSPHYSPLLPRIPTASRLASSKADHCHRTAGASHSYNISSSSFPSLAYFTKPTEIDFTLQTRLSTLPYVPEPKSLSNVEDLFIESDRIVLFSSRNP